MDWQSQWPESRDDTARYELSSNCANANGGHGERRRDPNEEPHLNSVEIALLVQRFDSMAGVSVDLRAAFEIFWDERVNECEEKDRKCR